jgi:hypothetical protein
MQKALSPAFKQLANLRQDEISNSSYSTSNLIKNSTYAVPVNGSGKAINYKSVINVSDELRAGVVNTLGISGEQIEQMLVTPEMEMVYDDLNKVPRVSIIEEAQMPSMYQIDQEKDVQAIGSSNVILLKGSPLLRQGAIRALR